MIVIARLHWAEQIAPGPPTGGDIPRQFFCLEIIVQKKILSIFIDKSGDFGDYDFHSPYYYVTMVFHDQSDDI